MDLEDFRDVLFKKRKELNMSRNDVARLVGISPMQIFNIEKKKTDVRLSTFLKIAKVLKIDVELKLN